LDFVGWKNDGTLIITPKFQRRAVWTFPARSFFIDTILRGLPVPPVYIRMRQSDDKKRTVREIVDGQQRLSAVLDFLEDKYKLSESLDATYAGKSFSRLSDKEQTTIQNYSFICEVMTGASDAEVLSIFARLNTYSVKLNDQELRNGRWFGKFKQSAYGLAHEHIEFWRSRGIFSEQPIARMSEVELTSELMVASLDGMQDKKKSLNSFYDQFDEHFTQQQNVQKRFRQCIAIANEVLSETQDETEFHRVALFYTLYCVIYHRAFSLLRVDVSSPKKFASDDSTHLQRSMRKLSQVLLQAKSVDGVSSRYGAFVIACGRQTDNIKPRDTRFRTLYNEAFG